VKSPSSSTTVKESLVPEENKPVEKKPEPAKKGKKGKR